VDGLGKLPRFPGAAAEFPEDLPGLELDVRTLAGRAGHGSAQAAARTPTDVPGGAGDDLQVHAVLRVLAEQKGRPAATRSMGMRVPRPPRRRHARPCWRPGPPCAASAPAPPAARRFPPHTARRSWCRRRTRQQAPRTPRRCAGKRARAGPACRTAWKPLVVEWILVDCLIHRGFLVLSGGAPPCNQTMTNPSQQDGIGSINQPGMSRFSGEAKAAVISLLGPGILSRRTRGDIMRLRR